jgi:hypothetical protein
MRIFLGLLAFAVLIARPALAQSQQENPPATQAQQGSSAPPQAQQGSSSPNQTQPQNPPAAQKNNPLPARARKKRVPSGQMAKIDVSAGGTFNRYTAPAGYYLDLVGWTGSANYNLFRWLSGQVEASGDYSNKALIGRTSVYTLLAGPEFFPLHHHKLTPWGHFVFGQGYYRDSIPSFGGFPAHVNGAFSFAWEGGAGLDMNVKRRWGIRLLEFDYASTSFFHGQPNQPRQSNYRLGVGIIYRIGKR